MWPRSEDQGNIADEQTARLGARGFNVAPIRRSGKLGALPGGDADRVRASMWPRSEDQGNPMAPVTYLYVEVLDSHKFSAR